MTTIDPDLRIRSVRLAVSNLPRSAAFYEQVLGLPLIASTADGAQLGPDGEHPALLLAGIERPEPQSPGSTGLFHVAWLHPSRSALAATVQRIVRAGWRIDGASDHGVSEALYLSDPDGLGIEIYADRPRERWQRPADGHGVVMVTLPLDIEDLLAQAPDEPAARIAPQTVVGHVHLKVADVPRAARFYAGTLGFEEQARLPSAAFLSAGGYHHHLGMNSWQSAGGAAPPANVPGLRLIEFELADRAGLQELERTVAADPSTGAPEDGHDGSLRVRDPDGHQLAFAGR
ncbi:MAG TPA: VOC family protein [Solirubrobacteraceae bacterium]|nr:VOC family protein [Solirubrobacteraceae bacterium]